MKTEHTPEPWRIGRFTGPGSYEKVRETCGAMDVVVDTDSGPYVLAGCNINFPDDAKANARRIVACVNACAGIPTEALEDGSARAERDALREMTGGTFYEIKKQRDELLDEFNAYKEGSEEAFGTVVAQKQAAEARLQTMQSTIASQQGVICDFREQRDELLEALQSISKITGEAGFNIGGPLEHCPGELEHDEAKRLLSLACEYLKDTSKAACRAIASVKGGAA